MEAQSAECSEFLIELEAQSAECSEFLMELEAQSAECSEFLIELEAQSAESLSNVTEGTRRRVRISVRVFTYIKIIYLFIYLDGRMEHDADVT